MAASHHDHADESPGGLSATSEDRLDEERRAQYAEEIGMLFHERGWPRMEGRVLGYLVMSNAPHTSSADLIGALRASAGSISTATRNLAQAGFIKRVTVPGDRSHYFRVEDDVFGTFLATEHQYLLLRARGIEKILGALGENESGPRRRLENMRDYCIWLYEYHHGQMLQAWEERKRERDAARDA
ncbi:GbsR/MarR family transcriptional regulator [Phytoactinopolyspora halotolerans]|uniref:Transcriptional regulator n=1 Tax=Phytoactinopolyspora halotolerans TaxID=1981512 RepID=A0A6L9SHA9_9ACTN|nr:transcriptional regulator [Phytoactinopolyspora halotolerans]NEE04044.1 transcriptional regulator [Phytoactinopolyspora halotolerans]